MSGTRMINVRGRSTRLRIDGDPSTPPVVLLHGIGRSLEDWAAVTVRLAPDFRVIGLDLPGFGFSARRPERATLKSFALGVRETLDALGEHRPVHLLGNSLGGAVALQFQAMVPERVASLALADAAGFGSEVAPMLRLIATPVIGRLLTMRTTALSAKMTERSLYANAAFATPTRIAHALAISEQPDPGDVARETVQALATIRGIRQQWREELFESVAQHPRPTLVMWGGMDRVLPAKQLDTVRRLVPHAQTHLFAGVGHAPQIECPDALAEVVRDFIATVPPPSGARTSKSTRS
ncbi:alpha/beta fold hydrolase [Streptomyces sp. NPDC017991]|uniref:alpha/beta fold hydrolase n=1 Tax=Streptomyces sp. NPDC017991 TaxID=3365026 RepID=UPI0037AF7202